MKADEWNEWVISPRPRGSCARLLSSIIISFLFSISFSLCFRDSSRCRKAHLSSTSLEISATAAFTRTSIIDDSWVWKGMHVAMAIMQTTLCLCGGGLGRRSTRERFHATEKDQTWRERRRITLYMSEFLQELAERFFRVAEALP